TRWSPQNSVWQVEEHPSFGEVLLSSHCSPQVVVPFPHSDKQKREQPSQSDWLPSSHVSPASMTLFPQLAGDIRWQSGVQAADPRRPSSHSSSGSSSPLPQPSVLQPGEQPSPAVMLPSSHSSSPIRTPFPHAVGLQLLSQPSPSAWLLSSHCS